MVATLPFFLENIYNCYIVLLVHLYTNLCHLTEFIPQIRSSLRSLVHCLVRPDLLVIYMYYCLFILFKELISFFFFFGSLDKCHTSVFNALINQCTCQWQHLSCSTKRMIISQTEEEIG